MPTILWLPIVYASFIVFLFAIIGSIIAIERMRLGRRDYRTLPQHDERYVWNIYWGEWFLWHTGLRTKHSRSKYISAFASVGITERSFSILVWDWFLKNYFDMYNAVGGVEEFDILARDIRLGALLESESIENEAFVIFASVVGLPIEFARTANAADVVACYNALVHLSSSCSIPLALEMATLYGSQRVVRMIENGEGLRALVQARRNGIDRDLMDSLESEIIPLSPQRKPKPSCLAKPIQLN
jgi:hypothetical protein